MTHAFPLGLDAADGGQSGQPLVRANLRLVTCCSVGPAACILLFKLTAARNLSFKLTVELIQSQRVGLNAVDDGQSGHQVGWPIHSHTVQGYLT